MEQLSMIAPIAVRPPSIADELLRQEFEEQFKPLYPRRKNNEWVLAFRAFRKARETDSLDAILTGLRRYSFSDEPQFRPMASTWLNQKRWQSVPHDLGVDAWGLGEYMAAQADKPSHGMTIDCYAPEALYPIFLACGWPETWRGSLAALEAWIKDGLAPDSIAEVIAEAVKMFGSRARLEAFDKRVRARARTV